MFRFPIPKKVKILKRHFNSVSSKPYLILLTAAVFCLTLALVLTVFLVTARLQIREKNQDPTSSLPSLTVESEAEAGGIARASFGQTSSQSFAEEEEFSPNGTEEIPPLDDGAITEEEVIFSLNSLREDFPEGAYWNHVGVEDWDEFTVTDTPCQHDLYWDTYCNTYSGGIQELFPQYTPMEQCLGFAALISDLVFGEDAPVETFTDYTALRPGDHIRLELTEHSMIVLTVEDEGITVVECNSDYEHCRISWDRFLSWDDLAAYSYEMECITRYGDG